MDLALGTGGFSFTGAFTLGAVTDITGEADIDSTIFLVQAGFLFPSTAWEIAARYSSVERRPRVGSTGTLTEMAAAVNYYLNGHGNKMTLDVVVPRTSRMATLNFFDV